jgi:hypothetical protein
MTGKLRRTADVTFIHADFTVIKLDAILQFLAKNTYEVMAIHPHEILRQLFVWNLLIRTLLTRVRNRGIYFCNKMGRYDSAQEGKPEHEDE